MAEMRRRVRSSISRDLTLLGSIRAATRIGVTVLSLAISISPRSPACSLRPDSKPRSHHRFITLDCEPRYRMAADAFQGYQREFLALRSSVQGKLDNQIPALRGGAFPVSPPLPSGPFGER
jgi:hypothetical protein